MMKIWLSDFDDRCDDCGANLWLLTGSHHADEVCLECAREWLVWNNAEASV